MTEKTRACLRCRAEFTSWGFANRMCPQCRKHLKETSVGIDVVSAGGGWGKETVPVD